MTIWKHRIEQSDDGLLIKFNANFNRHRFVDREARTANKGLAKVAVKWLIEHLFFVLSAVLAESFLLRIRYLRQAPNR